MQLVECLPGDLHPAPVGEREIARGLERHAQRGAAARERCNAVLHPADSRIAEQRLPLFEAGPQLARQHAQRRGVGEHQPPLPIEQQHSIGQVIEELAQRLGLRP